MAKKKSSKKKADNAQAEEIAPVNGQTEQAAEETRSAETAVENGLPPGHDATSSNASEIAKLDARASVGEHLASDDSHSPPKQDTPTPSADELIAEVTDISSTIQEGEKVMASLSIDDVQIPDGLAHDESEANGSAITQAEVQQAPPMQISRENATVTTDDTAPQAALRKELSQLQDALLKSQNEQRAMKITMDGLNAKADKLIEEKTLAETQYKSLFSKVNQMKTTLGARLKQDAEELSQNRLVIEDLETQNATLTETITHMQEQVVNSSESSSSVTIELRRTKTELETLQHDLQDKEAQWKLERKRLEENSERSMMTVAEWENVVVEERQARDALHDRIHDLEEQLSAQNTAYDNLRRIVEQDNEANTKLKNNLYELQESHQVELKETVDSLQSTINQLTQESRIVEDRAALLRLEVQGLNADLDKFRPYEQELKEKNLLIGKLRHEAVILNEHLTKALRLLKRGSSNDSVDRQLLNNLLLSFFQLPRTDSKRFEVLKILSSVLTWDDTQKEQAGLLRPGSTNSSLGPLTPSATRSPPMSPTINRGSMSRRTSGTLQLQAADFMGPNRESMSDLWINFLQSEAAMEASDQVNNAST